MSGYVSRPAKSRWLPVEYRFVDTRRRVRASDIAGGSISGLRLNIGTLVVNQIIPGVTAVSTITPGKIADGAISAKSVVEGSIGYVPPRLRFRRDPVRGTQTTIHSVSGQRSPAEPLSRPAALPGCEQSHDYAMRRRAVVAPLRRFRWVRV